MLFHAHVRPPNNQTPDPKFVADIVRATGQRAKRARIERNITQADLASSAGIGRRALVSFESGADVRISTMFAVLQALGLVDVLERLLPDSGPSPLEMLEAGRRQPKRKRVAKRRGASGKEPVNPSQWTWGDQQ